MTRLETILLVAFLVLGLLAMHLFDKAREAGRVAATALSQEQVTAGTGVIADRVATVRVEINKHTEEAAHAVEQIPSDDIPADVRELWLSGLRDNGAGRASPDRSAELPGNVRGSEP